ncbi:hypothetical protein H3146_00035 [Streptomyces sp. OF3]|uniref:Uncharacterized protein n=1 Tax=Streptomyces alkaliterrae TaxID=2213162 RepID=A0A7W3WH20_9ACTN|nr:hypothetical protein [Streptomyces alkaliterrae]MBB1251760.1 hypothetical protein [Streptomyces alkaliterrae]
MKTDPTEAARTEKILRLRVAGLSLRAIAGQVDMSHEGVAGRIRAALAELVVPVAEEYRQLETVRLDDLSREVYRVLASAGDNGELRLRAVDRLLRIGESRRKLWGLDAPEPLAVTLERRNGLEVDVVVDALTAALDVLDLGEEQAAVAVAAATARLSGEEVPRRPVVESVVERDLEDELDAFLREQGDG